jgi:hypothetical protein
MDDLLEEPDDSAEAAGGELARVRKLRAGRARPRETAAHARLGEQLEAGGWGWEEGASGGRPRMRGW